MTKLCIRREHHNGTFHIGRSIQAVYLAWCNEVHARCCNVPLLQIDHVFSRPFREEEQLMEIMPMDTVHDRARCRQDVFHTRGETGSVLQGMSGYRVVVHGSKMR